MAAATYTQFDGTALDAEQTAAVDEVLARAVSDDFVTYLRDGAPAMRPYRGGISRFVAFASVGLAYEIIAPFWARGRRDGEKVEYLLVLVDGQAALEMPDEGRSGVLHLMRFHRDGEPQRWHAIFLHCGHLTISELARMGAGEIAERIEAEAAREVLYRPGREG